mmetsp:Transcript_33661/g.78763  ORF Transcript_33661/g.78763 Transcript_33661/m.78763 type:complete len:214 (+) Transcript_33661:1155-1796(+)
MAAEPAPHGREARLLRVPCPSDGALGRARDDVFYRRPVRRRVPRPQRAASLALLRDKGRPRAALVRGGRARPPPRRDRGAEGAARARQDVPDRLRAGADHSGRGAQGSHGCRPPVQGMDGLKAVSAGRVGRGGAASPRAAAASQRAQQLPLDVWLHEGGGRDTRARHGQRQRGARIDGRRHAARRALAAAALALALLQAALCPGDQPADRPDT